MYISRKIDKNRQNTSIPVPYTVFLAVVVAVAGEHTRTLAPTALAVACLWPVAGDVPIFFERRPDRGVRGAGSRCGRGDWMVRRET